MISKAPDFGPPLQHVQPFLANLAKLLNKFNFRNIAEKVHTQYL